MTEFFFFSKIEKETKGERENYEKKHVNYRHC